MEILLKTHLFIVGLCGNFVENSPLYSGIVKLTSLQWDCVEILDSEPTFEILMNRHPFIVWVLQEILKSESYI